MFKSKKPVALLLMLAASPMIFTGCASGGYTMLRKVSSFVNKSNLLFRIVYYIGFSIIPVFGVAALLDVLIFNTMDFWKGTVSASNQEFNSNGYRVVLNHNRLPSLNTQVTVYNDKNEVVRTMLIEEKAEKLNLKIDGTTEYAFGSETEALSTLMALQSSQQKTLVQNVAK